MIRYSDPGLASAFEITEDDVKIVLGVHVKLEDNDSRLEQAVNGLNADEVTNAALAECHDDDEIQMDLQTNSAYREIENQLKAMGLIDKDTETRY